MPKPISESAELTALVTTLVLLAIAIAMYPVGAMRSDSTGCSIVSPPRGCACYDKLLLSLSGPRVQK